jgi:hypothetical protein
MLARLRQENLFLEERKMRMVYPVFLMVLFCTCFAHAGLNDGLVACYTFTGNANDSSGYNNNGSVYGATMTSGHNGTANEAYYFDGTNDYIMIPSSPSLDIKGSVSLCAWVKNNNDDDGIIIWRGDNQAGHDPYQLHLTENVIAFRQNRGDGVMGYYNRTSDVVDNAWHFWTAVFDEMASKSYLYKDGVLKNTLDVTLPIQYDTSGMWNMIGAVDTGNWQFFRGTIDEIRVYDRALTYGEVGALYVPEPATLLLIGLGGMVMAMRNRKS